MGKGGTKLEEERGNEKLGKKNRNERKSERVNRKRWRGGGSGKVKLCERRREGKI